MSDPRREPPVNSPNLPAPIDRAAIERIIQRAAELQTGEREIGEALSESEVLALGKEVGIPERYMRQAMLEERGKTTLPAAPGFLDAALGPGVVSAQRVVQGSGEDLEGALLRWMDQEELLEVQRQQPGRISWEALRPGRATLRRLTSRRPFMLAKARLVGATVTPLEPGFCLVGLTADIRGNRGDIIGGMAAVTSIGVAGAIVLGLLSPFLWLAVAPLPLAAGVAWGISRQHRSVAERTLLGLERALDHLERGTVKPSHALPPRAGGIAAAVLEEVRKALGT